MADAGRGALPFIVVVGLLLPMVVLVVALELQPNGCFAFHRGVIVASSSQLGLPA